MSRYLIEIRGKHLVQRFDQRNDNYEADEVDDQEMNAANNQKKSKSFVANSFKPWGGKRNGKQSSTQEHNLNGYLSATVGDSAPAIKRVKIDKTFRSWGGKRSGMNHNSDSNIRMLNEYFKRLELLNQIMNELDPNFDQNSD